MFFCIQKALLETKGHGRPLKLYITNVHQAWLIVLTTNTSVFSPRTNFFLQVIRSLLADLNSVMHSNNMMYYLHDKGWMFNTKPQGEWAASAQDQCIVTKNNMMEVI
jgi:hypothetical protein